MSNYLIFRIYGSMVSWGDIAIGGVRSSFNYPTKSAILGIISAALGINSDQENDIQELQESIRFAIRVDHVGELITDYHTIQICGDSEMNKNKYASVTRKNQLSVKELNTVLSSREYYCDALYSIILWQRSLKKYSLTDIQVSLSSPKYFLYLGRKSCPICIPIRALNIESDTIEKALEKADTEINEFEHNIFSKLIKKTEFYDFYWESGVNTTFDYQDIRMRKDKLQSRKRWQFQNRKEYYISLEKRRGL